MKLIGVQLSPFVRKVAVVLTLKGLDYEVESIMPGSTDADFRAISPLGKIPALVDGDFSLADSSVICEYLDEKYPEPAVMPQGVEQRAEARFLEEYGDSKLVEATSIIFIEKFANPNLFGKETDAERVASAEKELIPPHFDYLETRVPQEGFLFGALSTADISIVSPLYNAAYGGYTVDASRWPRYAAFVQRVTEHPAVVQVREAEKLALANR
ncbi:MAG: glutathione S-transferase family protein [Halioglobus sp.]